MIQVRNATLREARQLLAWAAAEGWNPGLCDADVFYEVNADGFFVAVDSDEPIGGISVANHTADFAFLGLYIVVPARRRQGVGRALLRRGLAHAAGRTIGLDGVEAQQRNYAKSRFVHAGANTRFTGRPAPQRDADIRIADANDIPALIAAEAAASGVEKPRYLSAWFASADGRTTLVSRGKAGIVGFCTVRLCGEGSKMGPLLADNAAIAQRLIGHAATMSDAPLMLDVPETSSGLSALCRQLGFSAGFRTARMYRGPHVAHLDRFYAVSNMSLG